MCVYTYLYKHFITNILCFKDRAFWNENCTMTNLMHKFLIDYIYLFTSALEVSGFLLAHLQRQRLEPLPKLYACL
jgi:hypothetical protein